MMPFLNRGPISSTRPVPPYLIEERKRNAILLLAVVQTWPEGNEPTDASLMERVLERDAEHSKTLYDRYARPVYSLVLRISQQPASAEKSCRRIFATLAKREALSAARDRWNLGCSRGAESALDFLRLKRRSNARARIRRF